MLTKDEVERAVPATLRSSITQKLVDTLNNVVADPIIADAFRNNFLSFTGVLKDGRFKTEDYLHAVMFVSYQLMGKTNLESYGLTFPQRYADLITKQTPSKDIAAYVSAFNKGKLVNLVREQTMVPTWVLNAHVYQQAINVQVMLMNDDEVSAKVRCEAANSLLTHLKRPEAVKAELSIEVKDSSGMNELKDTLTQLARQQQEMIQNGMTPQQVAAQPLITDAEFTVVPNGAP